MSSKEEQSNSMNVPLMVKDLKEILENLCNDGYGDVPVIHSYNYIHTIEFDKLDDREVICLVGDCD